MACWKVWMHGGDFVARSYDVEAASAHEAAEKVHGGPLDLQGQLGALRATVMATNIFAAKSDPFFEPLTSR